MRGLELIPTDDDDGDIFAFTMPERHDDELRQNLTDDEDWYYGDPGEDYLADDYWL
jgi:predicted nucleotidyltransferase